MPTTSLEYAAKLGFMPAMFASTNASCIIQKQSLYARNFLLHAILGPYPILFFSAVVGSEHWNTRKEILNEG